jgi:glycerophosphoryl diester phosphodiesterase
MKIKVLRWILALFYDLMALVALLMLATALLLPFNGGQRIPPGTLIYQLYLLVVAYLYFDYCWRHGGQTLGMKAWKVHWAVARNHWQTLKRFLAGLLVLGIFAGLTIALTPTQPKPLSFHDNLLDKSCCLDIAHAGGEIDGHPYTNSKEALDANYALGRRVFEIDFEKTRDGSWVLAHDWARWIERTGQVPTQQEFLDTPIEGQYTAMNLEDLSFWLSTHPDARVITDTKNNFPELFKAIARMPENQEQIIFQAYNIQDIDLLVEEQIPQERIIFTNYKANLSQKDLIALVAKNKIGALSLPYRHARKITGNLQETFEGIPVYVHGSPQSIKSRELQILLRDKGVAGYYLD